MIWMYNKDGSKLFESADKIPEGEGWVDSPAKVGDDTPSTSDLRAALTEKGIDFNPRWGVKKLQEALDASDGDDA